MRTFYLACCLFVGSWTAGYGQMPIKKVTEPAGKTLEKALKASSLTQPGAKPFHLKLDVVPIKGDPAMYTASIEETWFSPSQWKRVLSAPGVKETVVMNGSGAHYTVEGDYLPTWLRSFETALFNPVPDASQWNLSKTPLEHIELPNGSRSNPCQHAEFVLGIAPAKQVNFANVCFRPDGLLDFVGSPSYAMEFHDYRSFGKLKVAYMLIDDPMHDVNLKGTIVTLELAAGSAADLVASANGSSVDPLATVVVSSAVMKSLAGDTVPFQWPNPIPGHGMFTVWVSLDRTGKVREAKPLNSDESSIAANMTMQLIGRHWKAPVKDGEVVQVQGGLVVTYPPET